jgi:hypothetical protein
MEIIYNYNQLSEEEWKTINDAGVDLDDWDCFVFLTKEEYIDYFNQNSNGQKIEYVLSKLSQWDEIAFSKVEIGRKEDYIKEIYVGGVYH